MNDVSGDSLGLRCTRLSKSFGGIVALSDLSFSLPKAGIVGIVGPNGSGKSTLFNVINGLLRPDGGQWSFGDDDLTALAPQRIARRFVSRMFQDLRLARSLSAADNLALAMEWGSGSYGLTHADWLRTSGVTSFAELLAGQLSYGQQKLLAIACCLVRRTPLVLLDEPMAGVSPSLVPHIKVLMNQMASLGRLVLFIEHDLDIVRRVAGHVLVLEHGTLLAEGSPQSVLDRSDVVESYLA